MSDSGAAAIFAVSIIIVYVAFNEVCAVFSKRESALLMTDFLTILVANCIVMTICISDFNNGFISSKLF